jgi:hypothetical protein
MREFVRIFFFLIKVKKKLNKDDPTRLMFLFNFKNEPTHKYYKMIFLKKFGGLDGNSNGS